MQLNEMTLVITGATGGIGRELALALVEKGTRVILSGRDTRRLQSLRKRLPWEAVMDVYPGDLREDRHIAGLTGVAMRGGANGLINLGGCNQFRLLEQQTPSELDALIETNLLVPMKLTRQLLPTFKRASHGLIVNIGSTYGAIGYPGYSGYCASKFGLRGFTEALRRELADTDVTVCYVAPRATRTAMNAGRAQQLNVVLGNAEDDPAAVAGQIVQAIERGARERHLGFPESLFARVNRFWPAVVDGALAKQLPTIHQFASQTTEVSP